MAGDHQKVQLSELNELRDQAYENSLIYKEKTKKIHDSKIKNHVFNVADRVLLFSSRLKIFLGKLKTRWTGPFTIAYVFPYGTIELSQADGPNFKVMDISKVDKIEAKRTKPGTKMKRVNSIHSFDDMMRKFLSKYFPPSIVTKLRNEITKFEQKPHESLFAAWERYKLSIDRCPNHNMLLVTQIDTFYNGLTLSHRDTINAAAGGTFMQKTPKECYELNDNITDHHNH
uniref:Reverse transcriptase domain-containing protein n=1 Tax=Tanacetum cinerariifolium TaxID=118510 RepID=A0A6L2MQ31_TANCI|nr:reverse transcriptase domain-containing protein [Tanacetum cinerariifolium]